MNKLEVIEKEAAEELDRLKGRIADYDHEFRSAFSRQMGYAFLAGAALLRAKAIVPHGKFLEWREAELPQISRSSASRYTQFAEAVTLKDPTVGSLAEVKLLMEGEPLSPAQQQKIAGAVHDLADGKTLTEMYRDLGVIRQPEKPKHTPAKPLTPAEELAAEKEHARDVLDAWRSPLGTWLQLVNDEEDPLHHPKPDWQAALDLLTEATAACRKRLKGGAR